ncbi:hypothetical protein EDB81DRAFT_505452 [Dactylonectria macrodidyma]|uniref:Secreted protein n=1 Tax=Dactylonectria macrodidyma TaxID=307937 RepID=A0A9P9ETN0_9HYPO|nr:hypothetical protein EDB81DRAFT_505452 [Dactylonectria macrodidyma]
MMLLMTLMLMLLLSFGLVPALPKERGATRRRWPRKSPLPHPFLGFEAICSTVSARLASLLRYRATNADRPADVAVLRREAFAPVPTRLFMPVSVSARSFLTGSASHIQPMSCAGYALSSTPRPQEIRMRGMHA